MAGALNRPDASTLGLLVREPQRLRVAVPARRDRPLRNNRARRGRDHRQHVLIPMRVNTNDEVHLICKQPD